MHDHATHFLLLCPPRGFPLPIGPLVTSVLCHTTSCWGSTPSEWVIQSGLSHLDTSSHMHYNHLERVFPTSFFIQLLEKTHLMLTACQHRQHIVYFDSYVQGKCVLLAHHINSTCIPTYLASLGMHAWLMSNFLFYWRWQTGHLKMHSLPYRVRLPYQLQSCKVRMAFAWGTYALERSTLPCGCDTLLLTILERWVENGSFNPECMAEGDYSHSTAILLTLNPDTQGKDIESMGIGLIVHQCKALLGQISSIPHLIKYACPWWRQRGSLLALYVGCIVWSWVTMADTWPLPQTLHSAWPIPWISSMKIILLRWCSGTSRTTQFHSPQMAWLYASYLHGTAQSVSTWWLPAMDAFWFLEVCSSLKIFIQR